MLLLGDNSPVSLCPDMNRVYRALSEGKVVVEARNLRELGAKLRKAGLDPKRVEIRSSEPTKRVIHLGMRAKVNYTL